MHIIIATDIHGLTDHLLDITDTLTTKGSTVSIVDPYQGQKRSFTNETQAYQTFMDECGHEAYASLVKSNIESTHSKVIIIGFSAGASAVWKAIEHYGSNKVHHFIGFYPSQIRHYLKVKPNCPVTLLFPRKETHFEVDHIIQSVSKSNTVECIKTAYLHGFMNPLSDNYDEVAANRFGDIIKNPSLLSDIGAFTTPNTMFRKKSD